MGLGENTHIHLPSGISVLPTPFSLSPTFGLLVLLVLPLVFSAIHRGLLIWKRMPSVVYELTMWFTS
ncbi:hypothetical protein P170DRAFT_509510 [Aspergillus steynii IBT 23096]|uniref:Uncharacterized protein n=1 Tax=Aspergillus steynii IBT 23096 TaxID=1392250 RepID=A0A2I2G7I3_9EURO|nr:uncharacterized protein P170DRAFT_509510 [Aspergillus steynii IBT 23096]PLB48842.1 hypothetical protein P170DRAFT_509510 [Aspergillus steynii IBT 23096]